jgi:hypothetical protein
LATLEQQVESFGWRAESAAAKERSSERKEGGQERGEKKEFTHVIFADARAGILGA